MNLKDALNLKRKRSKYGNVKTESHGHIFDSKLEAARWAQLKILEAAGQIEDLQRQVPIPINVNGRDICKLVIDFQYWDSREKRLIWCDAKGMVTRLAALKLKLVAACYPNMKIEIWKGDC